MNERTSSKGLANLFAKLIPEVHNLHEAYTEKQLSLEMYLEALDELQRIAYRCKVRPFNRRGLWAGSLGILLLLFGTSVEFIFLDLMDVVGGWLEVILVMGIFSLAFAGLNFQIYFTRETGVHLWFQDLRKKVHDGSALLDI